MTLPETLWSGPRTSVFTPQTAGKLASLAQPFNAKPRYSITVKSRTDDSGDPATIQSVTDKRSYAVAEELASMGFPERRIVAKGLGARVPIVPNTTLANRAKNTRVLIVLTYDPQ